MPGHLSVPCFARGATLVGSLLLIGGCSMLPSIQGSDSFLGVITPYRMEIVQGNVLTKEQAALVKPGMSRNQVRDLLGSPMLTDVFHGNRWDYVFTIRRQGAEAQRRSATVFFKDDKLERLDAPDLPSEREFVAGIFKLPPLTKPLELQLTPEQTAALPRPPQQPAASAPATGAVRSYPPLEPL